MDILHDKFNIYFYESYKEECLILQNRLLDNLHS